MAGSLGECVLVVFLADFKECLRMGTDRANRGCFLADDQVAAVAALPHDDTGLLEGGLGFHIVQQRAVTLLVALLDGSHAPHLLRQRMEAFLVGFLSHTLIHIRPLEVLALVRGLEV